ncbi:helix-turn-helix domain-containing protein [Sphingopyxis sp. SE2]|uniref:helix-turn-helix domain-containing protein n=1 Tax=Sphingopyxis sp. SE2 TaxID=1586240 RepID=UPI0028C30745|nr:helix-turn-helix domain-containing protein [Sphingopyxis sp. SE2]MDT7527992.1 helix-turn-helix domain-containing protein [Sphingopyxis sp. SE2]
MTLSVRQASELTSLSERTMKRIVARGDVKSVMIGRRRLVFMDSLQDFLEAGTPAGRA